MLVYPEFKSPEHSVNQREEEQGGYGGGVRKEIRVRGRNITTKLNGCQNTERRLDGWLRKGEKNDMAL